MFEEVMEGCKLRKCTSYDDEQGCIEDAYPCGGLVDFLVAEIAALKAKPKNTWCAYCGYEVQIDDDAATKISEHIMTCLKHPIHVYIRHVEALEEQAGQYQARIKNLCTMSTVEMMCENESVRQHVTEWENRCLTAEARIKELEASLQIAEEWRVKERLKNIEMEEALEKIVMSDGITSDFTQFAATDIDSPAMDMVRAIAKAALEGSHD